MDLKKVLISGLLAGLVMAVVGMLASRIFGVLFPQLNLEYENAFLFRPWSDPLMLLYFLCPFVLSMALAWIWDKTKVIVAGAGWAEKGVKFALAYWLVSLSGMLISYSSFPISFFMVLSWTIVGLLQAICAGLVYAKINP